MKSFRSLFVDATGAAGLVLIVAGLAMWHSFLAFIAIGALLLFVALKLSVSEQPARTDAAAE